jgi:nitroreductase
MTHAAPDIAIPSLNHVPTSHSSAPESHARRVQEGRLADAPIDELFITRWSRRAISPRPLPFDVIRSLFEAARFAPSASNTQPWLFIYAADRPTRRRAHLLLKDQNRRWAERAPLLVFVFARRADPETGQPLRTGAFDTGAAWLSLALQAHRLGLVARAMGGIFHEKTYQAFGVPQDQFESMVAVAIGYPGAVEDLPEDLATKERPSPRRRQHEFVFNNRYSAPPPEGSTFEP